MAEHWYCPKTGSPQHFGAGGRPTSLREARAKELCPSSTSIQGALAKPALDNWIKKNLVNSAFTNPPVSGESPESYFRRIQSIAYQQTGEAAEYGTAFHKAAEDYFNGEPLDPKFEKQLQPIIQWKEKKQIEFLKLEHTFASPEHGFGGTIDIVATNPKGAKLICDYKTRKSKPNEKMRPYGLEVTQLASYAVGYWGKEAVENEQCHGVNIFVSSTEPGRVEIHGYKPCEMLQGWRFFQAIAECWFNLKGYDPRTK